MARKAKPPSLLVAIVGGSGAGKTWVADKLQIRLGSLAVRLSLDDFYRDRSHLSLARRCLVNYDHPRAIDWLIAERVLRDCLAGRKAAIPQYDFAQHSRLSSKRDFTPRPIVLLDGLWWLRRPGLRRLFALTVFIECGRQVRLSRRMARDRWTRGRDRSSVLRQFNKTVEPMNRRFVDPQARRAHLRLRSPVSELQLTQLERRLRRLLAGPKQA